MKIKRNVVGSGNKWLFLTTMAEVLLLGFRK